MLWCYRCPCSARPSTPLGYSNPASMVPVCQLRILRRCRGEKHVDNLYLLLYLYTKFHGADRLGRMARNWWPNVVGTTDRMLSERLTGFSGIRGRMSSELVAEFAGIDTSFQPLVLTTEITDL